MAKLNIEVRVKQKTLAVGNRKLKLEDNFEGAGIFVISNRKSEIILELSYRKQKDFSASDEEERIYNFFKNSQTFLKQTKVSSTQEENYNGVVFPAVIIDGKFNATVIYNR